MKGHSNYDFMVSYNLSSGLFLKVIIRSKIMSTLGFLTNFGEIEGNCHVMMGMSRDLSM